MHPKIGSRKEAASAAIVALLVLGLAGCIGEKAVPDAAPSPSAAARPSARANETPVVVVDVVPVPPPNVVSWNSTTFTGNVGVSFRFSVLEKTPCETQFGFLSKIESIGLDGFQAIRQGDSSMGWGAISSGTDAQVHVSGTLDTRPLLAPDGYMGGRFTSRFTASPDVYTLTAGARNVSPWPGEFQGFLDDNATLSIRVECEAPVMLESAEAGREAVLFNAESLDGGQGASVFLVATVAHEDGLTRTFEYPAVQFLMGSFGYQAGSLDLAYPGGEKTCDMSPADPVSDCSHRAGPGPYAVKLTRAGVVFEAFWGALLGLQPLASLDEIALLPAPAAAP